MTEIFTVIGISLLLSAFFSAIEIAFVSANPLKLTLMRNENSRTAKLLNYFYDRQDFFLGTTLVGNTLTLVVYGIYMSELIDMPIRENAAVYFQGYEQSAWFELAILVLQTTISTIFVLLFAEFTPKSVAMAMPNLALEYMIHIMNIFAWILKPFVWVIVRTNQLLLFHVFKIPHTKDNKAVGIADLSHYLMSQSVNNNEEYQHEVVDANIFQNAIAFKKLKVRNCMIPRTDIIAIDKKQKIEDLSRAFISSGHSKIIIYDGNLDNIVGYCHALSLFENPTRIENVTTKVIIVPETTGLQEMMLKFLTTHKSIAVVTDEFGGTSGIVTIEDIIEEILGDIEDEHDESYLIMQKINDKEYEISARFKIADLNHDYKWGIPEGEYDTLGGYIMSVYGAVPEVNTVIETDNFVIKVLSMEGVRTEKVSFVLK